MEKYRLKQIFEVTVSLPEEKESFFLDVMQTMHGANQGDQEDLEALKVLTDNIKADLKTNNLCILKLDLEQLKIITAEFDVPYDSSVTFKIDEDDEGLYAYIPQPENTSQEETK